MFCSFIIPSAKDNPPLSLVTGNIRIIKENKTEPTRNNIYSPICFVFHMNKPGVVVIKDKTVYLYGRRINYYIQYYVDKDNSYE